MALNFGGLYYNLSKKLTTIREQNKNWNFRNTSHWNHCDKQAGFLQKEWVQEVQSRLDYGSPAGRAMDQLCQAQSFLAATPIQPLEIVAERWEVNRNTLSCGLSCHHVYSRMAKLKLVCCPHDAYRDAVLTLYVCKFCSKLAMVATSLDVYDRVVLDSNKTCEQCDETLDSASDIELIAGHDEID